MPNCSVVGCSNSYKSGRRIFRFPSGKCDIDRRNIWISKTKRENFHPTKDSAICEVHFERDQFEVKIPGKLKRDAIPTLFPYKKVVSHRKPPKDRSPGSVNDRTRRKKTSITIDVMGLQPSIDIDPRNGSISGSATVPQSSTTESKNSDEHVLATHGLVVMLRSISTPWKQVVAYEFTAYEF